MNEYYEQFQELQEKSTFKGQQWFGERGDLVEEYSWAVPNEEVLVYLAEFDKLIEVGAGGGYWAKCIQDEGGVVFPIDESPPAETYTNIHTREINGFYEEFTDEAILMVWPPYDEPMAADVAQSEPDHICYVGEERGGCTATDRFFNILDRKYGLVAKIDLPSYAGIHDNFFHYIRKF
jgi:hypothetical protein